MAKNAATKQTTLQSFFSVGGVSPLTPRNNQLSGLMPPEKRKSSSCTTGSTENSKENSPKKLRRSPRKLQCDSSPQPTATRSSPRKRVFAFGGLNKPISLASETNGLVVEFGSSWKPALSKEFKKDYFVKLSKFVQAERTKATIYPKTEHVFSWTTACSYSDVKVVILGQDPYHGPNQAHGLCFSVLPSVSTPPSLQNMYKELFTDIEGFTVPDHGYLKGWAQQGVLLLNAVLTVQKGNANSHKDKGWEQLTDAVIKHLNDKQQNLVFMLWGSYAQKKGGQIDKRKHCILKGVHPSPLSAHRGFFGCKHFSQANAYLKKHSKTPIDWSKLPKDC